MTGAGARALLAASARSVSWPASAALAVAAVLPVAVPAGLGTLEPSLLHACALLLALVAALAADEPAAAVLDAVPVPWSVRVAARLVALAAVVLPVWSTLVAVTLGVVRLRAEPADVGTVAEASLELVVLSAAVLAAAAALRRWRRLPRPALLVAPAVLLAALGVRRLAEPAGALGDLPPLPADGPAGWAIALVVAFLAAGVALRDPSTARTHLR